MKKINILIVLSLILLIIGYNGFREFTLIRRGNKLSTNKKYTEADSAFKKVVSTYDSSAARSNSVINLYEGKLYRELLDGTNGIEFFRGNSEVYLSENEQDIEDQIEGYRKALEEYKLAMKKSDDINIKKNYEIIGKRIDELQNQQQQEDQENQDKEDNQEQDKNKNSNQNNDSKEDYKQNNQNENKKSDDNQQNKGDNQGEEETDSNNQQDKENKQGQPEGKTQEKTTEIKEALATLEKLENSEEQAFKNNERLEYLGGDTDESW